MIKIICVGKIKEKYLEDGIKEYFKRIEGYQKIQILEVKEFNTPDISKNMYNEGLQIKEKISKDDYIITLEINGKKIDSVQLAKKIEEIQTYHSPNISFIIGGSNGLIDDIKKLSNFALSFSDMTFPHQLMRLILVEQIYRAFTIINNKEYHK